VKPYLADPDVILYQGDAPAVLRELPDESVHCIATSPPFYGLRDYGTGRWEGGDERCPHIQRRTTPRKPKAHVGSDGKLGRNNTNWDNRHGDETYGDICGKCGARRIDQQIGLEETPACQRQGFMRLKAGLTPDQREFVARRLLELGLLDA
jgi:hypothetical protein